MKTIRASDTSPSAQHAPADRTRHNFLKVGAPVGSQSFCPPKGVLILGSLFVFGLLLQDTPAQTQRLFDWTRLPFHRSVYQQRRVQLMDALSASGGGVLLVPSRHARSRGETFRQLDDFNYLSGLELPDSVLALDSDQKQTLLFAPGRDSRFEDANRPNDFPGRKLGRDPELPKVSGIADLRDYAELEQYTAQLATDGRIVRVNGGRGELARYETDFVRLWGPNDTLLFHLQRHFPKLRLENAFAQIAHLRMIKSAEEIALIRRACALTARAMLEAVGAIRPGVDERSLEAVLESAFKRGGGQRVAFSSIIKSGPNSLWPWRILASHYDRRNRRMSGGELVIFDVGTELDYYVSDVGRTFPVSGEFSQEQRRLLRMVTSVSDAIISAARPGITHAELVRIGGQAMPAQERKYMQPGAFNGHHIGLDTSDPALLDTVLAPGMVFTVEPIYYNHDKGIAVFIEDVVLITPDGSELLTGMLPRRPEDLEKLVPRS